MGKRVRLGFLLLLFLFLDIIIVLAYIFIMKNVFTEEKAKGNFPIQSFSSFTYSLQGSTYKADEKNDVCLVTEKNSCITRTEYKLAVNDFNRTTRIRDNLVLPTKNGVAEESVAVTLFGDWYEINNGIDSCKYTNANGTQLRVDYCILPIDKISDIDESVILCRDKNLEYITTLASDGANAGLLRDSLSINGCKQLKEMGFKVLNNDRYVVVTTYIQLTDRVVLTLRAYINISCLNSVSFTDLQQTEINQWGLWTTEMNVTEVVKSTNEITKIMTNLVADVFKYDTGDVDYTNNITKAYIEDWVLTLNSVCIDVTHLRKESFFEKVYLYKDGLIYLKTIDASTDKINSSNRDSLVLNLSSNLIDAKLINKLNDRLSGNIIRKVKGLTLNNGEKLATLNYFVFTNETMLEVSIVDYVHSDTEINIESLVKSLEGVLKDAYYKN